MFTLFNLVHISVFYKLSINLIGEPQRKVQLFLYLLKHHAMKIGGGVEI
jgi:hypothetical protein